MIGAAIRSLINPVRRLRGRRAIGSGQFNRSRPLSREFGYDRGTPIDRYYIERFLDQHRADIRGAVLEVKDSGYARRYGSGITSTDVLDVDAANPNATVIADLASADAVAAESYDCFILTQTLTYIFDVTAAVRHTHRILRPGGVALVTVPTVSRLCPPLTDHWRFTPAGCQRLFGDVFGSGAVEVRAHGSAGTGAAFLMGLAYEELPQSVLDHDDAQFPVLVTVRAVRR
jgi:SAM-dependent methyltransferase